MTQEPAGFPHSRMGLDSSRAAPLLCAGLTTFSALRIGAAKAGDLVGSSASAASCADTGCAVMPATWLRFVAIGPELKRAGLRENSAPLTYNRQRRNEFQVMRSGACGPRLWWLQRREVSGRR